MLQFNFISIIFQFYFVLYCCSFYILIIQEIVAAICFISTSNKDRTCRKKMIPELLQSLHSKTFTIVVLILLLQGMIASWPAISTSKRQYEILTPKEGAHICFLKSPRPLQWQVVWWLKFLISMMY